MTTASDATDPHRSAEGLGPTGPTGPADPGPTGPTGWTSSSAARAGRHPVVRALALGLGGLLTIVLVAGAAYAAANVLVRTTETDTTTLEGEVVRAVISVDGSVELRAGPPGQVRVERRSTFGLSRPDITRTLEDGLLTVRVTCGDLPGVCATHLDIDLPPEAEVSVTGDRIGVTGLHGRVEATSDGGSVELVDLDGTIDVRAGGGAVTGEGLRSDQVRASVGAGALDLGFARAPSDVDASSGAGSVVIVVPPDGQVYRVEATAGAGSREITVATDPTSPRRIRAGTGAGSVVVRYGTS